MLFYHGGTMNNESIRSTEERRKLALEQAAEVLKAVGGPAVLDALWLPIVANPRQTSTTTSDSYITFEGTFTQMSEWTEAYLEDWSRSILEEDYNTKSAENRLEQPPPEEFQNIDTHALDQFVQSCGKEAETFRSEILEESAAEPDLNVPDIFHGATFDLTDPTTFRELLVDEDVKPVKADLDNPVEEWFPIVSPDSFSAYLDRVELALLNQVRSQSTAFFEESNRFANLQNSIHELLQQVTELSNFHKDLRRNVLQPLKTIPDADTQRHHLLQLDQLIGQINDILDAKQSIIYHLEQNDDTTAIELIQQTRERVKPLLTMEALAKLPDQLDQYEQLVISKLRDELVEIFLGNSDFDTERVLQVIGILGQSGAPSQDLAKAYQTRLLDVTRLTVRTVVGEFDPQGASAMSLGTFLDCLDMIFEQLTQLFQTAKQSDKYLVEQGISLGEGENETPLEAVIAENAELSGKLIAELLKVRKEAHSLISLDDMRRIWSKCTGFCQELEDMSSSGRKIAVLRSTLVGQAKYFLERKHESNMSSLVAALDSERWTQCDVSRERQSMLTRLCTGRSLVTSPSKSSSQDVEKSQEAEVGGTRYKVVWSCLLLIEMILDNISAAIHFNSLATNAVTKIAELLRLFNSRTSSLVLGAGAIHSTAKLKSINAKHLSIVTQCLGLVLSIFPHIRAALMAQMPERQHALLSDLDQIKKEYSDHNEKVLNKFASIIGDIIEHSLAPKIGSIDFDKRAKEIDKDNAVCSIFFEGMQTNIRKMHQVLRPLLPPSHLVDVFSRIYATVDQKIPVLLNNAQNPPPPKKANARPIPAFRFPITDEGKYRLLFEAETTTKELNAFEGVQPWDFTVVRVLERQLEYELTKESDENGVPATESNGNGVPAPVEEHLANGTYDVDEDNQEETEKSLDAKTDEPEAAPTQVEASAENEAKEEQVTK